jgi:hypothetical protein
VSRQVLAPAAHALRRSGEPVDEQNAGLGFATFEAERLRTGDDAQTALRERSTMNMSGVFTLSQYVRNSELLR